MSFWRRRIALDPANDGEWQRWEEDSASGSDAATETGGGRTIDQLVEPFYVQIGRTNAPISTSTALRRSKPADRRSDDRRRCRGRLEEIDERGLERHDDRAGHQALRDHHAQGKHGRGHGAAGGAITAVPVFPLVWAGCAARAVIGLHGHARGAFGRRAHVAHLHATGARHSHTLENQGERHQDVEESFAHSSLRLPALTGISSKSSRPTLGQSPCRRFSHNRISAPGSADRPPSRTSRTHSSRPISGAAVGHSRGTRKKTGRRSSASSRSPDDCNGDRSMCSVVVAQPPSARTLAGKPASVIARLSADTEVRSGSKTTVTVAA